MSEFFTPTRILKHPIWGWLSLALLLVIFSAHTTDKAIVAVNIIPNLLEEKKTNASYTRILNKLNAMVGNKMKFDYFPSSRASKLFSENKSDCLFPASTDSFRRYHHSPVIESLPVNYAIAFVFSRSPFDLPELIKNQKPRYAISYRRSTTFGNNINDLSQHTLFEVNSDQQSFAMLDSRRVDFVIAYMPDVKKLIERPNGQKVYYNPQQAFHTQGDNLLCHLSEDNTKLLENINSAIAILKTSGELSEILGDAYLQPQ